MGLPLWPPCRAPGLIAAQQSRILRAMTRPDLPMSDLTGKLLIAMPDLGDPRFHGSVVIICSYSAEGAMGLIVNRPMPDVAFRDVLGQLGIAQGDASRALPVLYGGPVDPRRGFVLHSAGDAPETSDLMVINEDFALTATTDILRALARGAGPARALMALGYAGWGPGQLEGEIAQNSWLIADAQPDLVFAPRHDTKWTAALASLGIAPLALSSQAGRA